MYIRETPRANGICKHGNTVGKLELSLYGNPSGTYYYVQGLFEFLRKHKAEMNQAEACLIRIEVAEGTIIMAVAVDDFLVTASTPESMNKFEDINKAKYKIKRLGKPKRYLSWHIHYNEYGDKALSQRILIDKTLNDAILIIVNRKGTPYPVNTQYHPPKCSEQEIPESKQQYMKIIGS